MRIAILIVLFAFLTPTFAAGAPIPTGHDTPTTVAGYQAEGFGTLLSWTPFASAYSVYRGDSVENLTLIHTTRLTAFHDRHLHEGPVFYGVAGRGDDAGEVRIITFGESGGRCVTTTSSAEVSVSLGSCLKWN